MIVIDRRRRLGRPHLVLLAAAWLVAGPALARDLTPAERASLTDTVSAYETAMHEGDADRVVGVMPPRLLAEIASEHGVAPDALREAIEAQLRKVKAQGVIETITLDLAKADFASLADGTPYVLIPSHVVVEAARTLDSRFETLALIDGGRWHLVDVSSPDRVATFVKAFPAFAGVDFGAKTLETKP